MKRILVLGSLNIDLVLSVPRLALPGETLEGAAGLRIFVGGKGANQACAAARLGGHVRMAGKVGTDVFAQRILGELRNAGVQTEPIGTSAEPSGSAVIFVLPNGENTIVISPGANGDVPLSFALNAVEEMDGADILLCQFETPIETVAGALKTAYKKGAITILDPAPARRVSEELLSCVSVLTPNQTETAILLDRTESPANFDEAAAAAYTLQRCGAHSVIIKMGAAGCCVLDKGEVTTIRGYPVSVLDTTAAGDTFNGALATSLARGDKIVDAARFANAAAALSVTRSGAIASVPGLAEVESFLEAQPVPN